MSLLADREWKAKYSRDDGDIVRLFYVPALRCAVRYDRTTGYFTATALAIAARGVEELVRNGGRMRLVVGCTLEEEEVAAIERGAALRDAVAARVAAMPLVAEGAGEEEALELLAWMVGRGLLDVKVAVPCDADRRPVAGSAIFHEKVGIIEDKVGDRLAFSGGINETRQGWTRNWDSFHVYTSWTGLAAHVDADEETFGRLWSNTASEALVVDVPTALREQLLTFLPADDAEPRRLRATGLGRQAEPPSHATEEGRSSERPPAPVQDPRRVVWSFILGAPKLPNGGERIGEATCAVTPWPHQVRAFHRLYGGWPPKLLIADEVGLGKTIQAGLLLRQAWLAGRARRILVMAPRAVLRQWQLELREKFNLNWPIYDGQRLSWAPSPVYGGVREKVVERDAWHRHDQVLVSSQLLRRRERARELLEQAEPWDLVVVDEAHHARRSGGGLGADDRPNLLLRLLRRLRERTKGLVLLTATPMQVSPIEVFDLLDLPPAWHAGAFLNFFEDANHPNPSHEALAHMARLFRAVEETYGEISMEEAQRLLPNASPLRVKRALRALRDEASIPLRQLAADERRGAVRLMKASTPIRCLVSRHTRELLRAYQDAGKISARIARREVEDRFVEMSAAEREVYDRVENYISTTYNNAAPDERTAVGFVMTVYRRRLASSFHALACTLENRLAALGGGGAPLFRGPQDPEEDVADDEARDEVMDADEAACLEREALALEERGDIEALLRDVRRLPTDKGDALGDGAARAAGGRLPAGYGVHAVH